MVKWIAGLGLGALVLVGIYLAVRTPPVSVDIARAVEAPMAVTINQEGRTRVKEVYTVSAPIAGRLSRTVLDVGDAVVANETVVASIQPLEPALIDRRTVAEVEAMVEAARAAVVLAQAEETRAETALDLAKGDLDRATSLSRNSVISKRALEKAIADVNLAEAQLLSAQAQINVRKAELASAEARLMQPGDNGTGSSATCCVSIFAPTDGVVLEILTKSEQAVVPGTRIATIGDPGKIEIIVELLSADAVRIATGTKARISNWGGEKDLMATVTRIDPTGFTKVSALGIEEQRVNAVLELDQVEPALGHGFRIYARLAIWEEDNVLQIPISAIFRHDGNWAVFRSENGQALLSEVEIGMMSYETAQIKSGLASGDAVILHPSDQIADGSAVETSE